jgi:hypothetical protein
MKINIIPPDKKGEVKIIWLRRKFHVALVFAVVSFFCLLILGVPLYLNCNNCDALNRLMTFVFFTFLVSVILSVYFFFSEKKTAVKVKVFNKINNIFYLLLKNKSRKM